MSATTSVAKKVRTNIYLNKYIKEEAQKVLEEHGLSLSEAINLFLSIIAKTQTIPFEFRLPNRTTRKAIQEVLTERNLEEVTVRELLDEIKKTQAVHQRSEENSTNR